MAIDEMDVPTQLATTVFANTANNVSGVLSAACAATDTSLSLTPGGGALFPNAPFYCSCEFEVMWCLAKSGDSLVVQRGMDGTAATSHAVANLVEMRNNAGLWTDLGNAINNLETGVASGSALPADLAYVDKTQEFTNKTIDLTDSAKGNVIIGTVSPDPSQLVYENLLYNGGFEDWFFVPSTTLAAGSPTSGARSASFTNGWTMNGYNDSSISCTQDTATPDFNSTTDCVVNVTTVQANDSCAIQQSLDYTFYQMNDLNKWRNQPVSISARASLISGNLQMRFRMAAGYTDGSSDNLIGTWLPVTAGFSTYKFENQVIPTKPDCAGLYVIIEFKGAGSLRLDNIMMTLSPVATLFRPKFVPWLTGIPNKLINGGFEVSQRGSAFSAVGTTIDKWVLSVSGAGLAYGINQIAVATNPGSNYYGYLGLTLPAAPPGGLGMSLINKIENYGALIGQTITLTGLVTQAPQNANGGFVIRIAISSISMGVQYSRAFMSPSDGGWHQFASSIWVPGDTTLIQVEIVFNGPINPNAGFQARFDNLQLVPGFLPAEYETLNFGEELERCKRYYEIAHTVSELGYAGAAGYATGHGVKFVEKFAVPTITKTNWSDTYCTSSLDRTTVNGSRLFATPAQAGPYESAGALTYEANP